MQGLNQKLKCKVSPRVTNLGPSSTKALLERKRKWTAERQRRDEELEELRRSSQQEMDGLRAQLRKARTSSSTAASEQVDPETNKSY